MTTTKPDGVVVVVVVLVPALAVLPVLTFCPTVPVIDVIVPSPGAVSVVEASVSCAC